MEFTAELRAERIKPSVFNMTKYEPNYYVPCDRLRGTKVLCKEEPLNAGFLASNFLNDFLSDEQKNTVILNENISKIIPRRLQEKVKIVAISRETLLLKAASSVWRAEVMGIKSEIIFACNKVLGKIAVKGIRV